MNLGKAIKAQRKISGYSQKDFAERLGISVTALVNIEVHNASPREDTFIDIAYYLGVSRAYLTMISIEETDLPTEKRVYYDVVVALIKMILS